MVLADSSAWIAYLRGGPVVAADRVEDHLRAGTLATADPVILEVLAGARSSLEERRLLELLGAAERFPCERADYVESARLYRACRSAGDTVRSMLDCLIAAVAIRTSLPVLHVDRDFDAIARLSNLETLRL